MPDKPQRVSRRMEGVTSDDLGLTYAWLADADHLPSQVRRALRSECRRFDKRYADGERHTVERELAATLIRYKSDLLISPDPETRRSGWATLFSMYGRLGLATTRWKGRTVEPPRAVKAGKRVMPMKPSRPEYLGMLESGIDDDTAA